METTGLFESQPIYQVYSTAVELDNLRRTFLNSGDDDRRAAAATAENVTVSQLLATGRQQLTTYWPAARSTDNEGLSNLTLEALVKTGVPIVRRLWKENPRVKNSDLLSSLNSYAIKLQEALFEIVTSDTSYVKSLNILESTFMKSLNESGLLTTAELQCLFSNVKDVNAAAHRMQKELELLWIKNVMLDPVEFCSVVDTVAKESADAYVSYCSNMKWQERTALEIRKRSDVATILDGLEWSDATHKQTLQSYLVLPMQRSTRMPLLVTGVLDGLNSCPQRSHTDEDAVRRCLETVKSITAQCNKSARAIENLEQLKEINRILHFRSTTTLTVVQPGRLFMKRGDVTLVVSGVEPFKTRKARHLILFNDLLLITKKKSADRYVVKAHAERRRIYAAELNSVQEVVPFLERVPKSCDNLMLVKVYEDVQSCTNYVFACKQSYDRESWIAAILSMDNAGTRAAGDGAQWQQVPHVGKEPDDSDLGKSAVVDVLRRASNSWYESQQLNERKRGLFRLSRTVEVDEQQITENLRRACHVKRVSSIPSGTRSGDSCTDVTGADS